jgi:putative ABC transport system permease protein
MSMLQIILQSWRHHGRIHSAVALGVAAATAVLTGALLVGDSVRGSLRHLTLDRLGRIEHILVLDRFFRQELASELADRPELASGRGVVAPAILFPSATVEAPGARGRRLASGVLVLGGDESFWKLSEGPRPQSAPAAGEIVINSPLAAELGVQTGDTLVVRFGKADQVPADSPLGRRTDRIASLAELTIREILPAEGLGRFSLHPTQVAPRNAYVSLAAVQAALDVTGKVNTIFVGGLPAAAEQRADARPLGELLAPQLEDYGLMLKHVELKFGAGEQAETVLDYYNLASDRMLLEPAAARIAATALAEWRPQPVLTYLANEIAKVDAADALKAIPYSTITAIDPAAGGPLVDLTGQPLPALADDEIVLTSWAAEDQQARIGDRIRVTYFEPETTHGQARETSQEFRVRAIVPLVEPKTRYSRRSGPTYDVRPSPANDPDLTPTVQGITDQASIDDWDAPFPFDLKRIREQDDTYWDNHRTTPKAYVSLATGRKLWGSRFGDTTSLRIPAADGISLAAIEQRFQAEVRRSGERLGFEFQPIKAQGLAASSGTTPFDVLFLLLSMFVIAAALLLVWLLFRLGVEQRAGEMGLLLALGWSRQRVRRLFIAEGSLVAGVGAVLGASAGIGYAWLMLAGLRSWWVGAVATPFLELYIRPQSLVIGLCAGLAVSVLTIWFSLGRVKQAIVRSLLGGEIVAGPAHNVERGAPQPASRRAPSSALRPPLAIVAAALFLAAVALAFYAATLGGEAQAGAFLGSGAALLVSLLLLVIARLRAAGARSTLLGGAVLGRLAFRNACRNVGRSAATIALVASAAFLIVAVSAFRMSPTSQGIGGFDLLAESSQPIYEDLDSPAGRKQLLADQAQVLDHGTVLALRLKPGDDASCRNLYQPSQPRVLGVTPRMIAYFDDAQLPARFAWSAQAATDAPGKANPWRLLAPPTPAGQPVPVVLDQNTALYSLRLYGGIGQRFDVTYADNTTIQFQIVGLLANSMLQGNLLIGEANFQRLFPQLSGYRFFLIRSPPGQAGAVTSALEGILGDEGFDAIDSRTRLADLLAVQNTYISTFQSLGALGLVLGTFGLAAVQLRSVFERRKELALLRATGFRPGRLGRMVLLENLWLLWGGLALGTLAALVAVLPQMLLGAAQPPLVELAAMLGVVFVVGVMTGLIAVRATLRAPLVGALRGE